MLFQHFFSFFSDDYDENGENFDPYVSNYDEAFGNGGDIKPDLDGFDFKVPSSKAKRKRGRPRKNPEKPVAAKKTKRAPRKSPKRARKSDLQDFVDDEYDGEGTDEDWDENQDEDEEETKIKTEDGTAAKAPRRRRKKVTSPAR